MKFIKQWLILSLSIILITAACGGNQPQQSDLPPLRLGVNPWAGYSSVYIAAEKGFFEQQGVKVEIVKYDTTDASLADFAGRKLDLNLGLVPDSLAQAAAGIPVQVVWVFDNSAGSDVVVGRSDLKNPEDLKGKRIGVTFGGFSHIFVVTALAKYGIQDTDVTFVNVRENEIQAAIAANQIDAGHTWDPYLSEAVKSGDNIIFTSKDTPGLIADALMVHTEVVEKRRDEITKILRGLIAAYDWWQTNPDEGNKIIATAIGAKPEDMAAIFAGIQVFSLQDNVTAFDPATQGTVSIYQSSQIAIDILIKDQIIKNPPDPKTVINPSFVQALSGK